MPPRRSRARGRPLSSLELMPVEMIAEIMSRCDDPEDLQHLVQSSSVLWAAFRADDKRILVMVIQSSFPGTNFRDACWAIRASHDNRGLLRSGELHAMDDYQAAAPGRRTRAAVIRDIGAFVDQYHGAYERHPLTAMLAVARHTGCGIMAFFRLWWFVKKFTRNFHVASQGMLFAYATLVHRVNASAFGLASPYTVTGEQAPDRWACYWTLSDDESARIQRAFLRFEIFRCLVPPRFRLMSDPAAAVAWDRLRRTFVAWEWAEMYTVGHFLVDEVGEVVSKMADKLKPQLNPHAAHVQQAITLSTDDVFERMNCWFLCRFGYPSLPHWDWLRFRLAHLGLPFLHLLMSSPVDLQVMLINDYANVAHRQQSTNGDDFQAIFLAGVTWNWQHVGPNTQSADEVNNTMLGPGPGWQRWKIFAIERGFEGTGFVFWDKDRLDEADLHDKVPIPSLLSQRQRNQKAVRKLSSGRRMIDRLYVSPVSIQNAHPQRHVHDRFHRHTHYLVWENEYAGRVFKWKI